ncbi:MAG: hypothetical protein ABNH26_15025 [Celeribacter sp.]|jgi:hypothetical protein
MFWLMRARRWVQNPPPMSRVLLVIAVIGICLALFAVERWIGLPEWMSADPRGGRVPRL